MKSTLRLLGLVVLFIVAAAVATFVMRGQGTDQPVASATPTATPTPVADNMIILDDPLPGATISSPLTVRGKARGTWFFEASFPVVLTDAAGSIIAQVPAQAKGDWMTTEFVPFEATLTFVTPAGPGGGQPNYGTLTLKKDNPSGLPEHDDSRAIKVFFK